MHDKLYNGLSIVPVPSKMYKLTNVHIKYSDQPEHPHNQSIRKHTFAIKGQTFFQADN